MFKIFRDNNNIIGFIFFVTIGSCSYFVYKVLNRWNDMLNAINEETRIYLLQGVVEINYIIKAQLIDSYLDKVSDFFKVFLVLILIFLRFIVILII